MAEYKIVADPTGRRVERMVDTGNGVSLFLDDGTASAAA